jgi:tRNA threonylcarbamoyladenosine biosynthesis protein TsaB
MLIGLRSGTTRTMNLASGGNHAQDILLRLEEVLEGCIPDILGVSVGPGSFTGLRIGLSTAKGLSEGWNRPLWGLDNLAAMAKTWQDLYPRTETAVLCALDARKQKFYGGLYLGSRVLIPGRDWSAERWRAEVAAVWNGPVAVSGYQGHLLALQWSSLPEFWESFPLDDWTVSLLDQLDSVSKHSQPLTEHSGPVYLRLSEAQELQSRTGT